MCYCKNSASDLDALPESIKAAVEKLDQLKAGVEQHQADKVVAKAAMAESTAIWGKEAAEYAKQQTYYDTPFAAIMKAVAALEKGNWSRMFANFGCKCFEKRHSLQHLSLEHNPPFFVFWGLCVCMCNICMCLSMKLELCFQWYSFMAELMDKPLDSMNFQQCLTP